jgi:hypothetical protein
MRFISYLAKLTPYRYLMVFSFRITAKSMTVGTLMPKITHLLASISTLLAANSLSSDLSNVLKNP